MSLYKVGAVVASEYDSDQAGTIVEVDEQSGLFLVDWGASQKWEDMYDIYILSRGTKTL